MTGENRPASKTRLERQPRCSSVHCSTGAIMKVPRPVPHTQIPEMEFLDISLTKQIPEMEFLDISLTKDHPYKKIRETRKLESFHE
jgi:hypothetical protein